MKVKFNKFERVAGVFVMTVVVGCFVAAGVVAVKKGWFERKVVLTSKFQSASGINPGTQVLMSGLRIGSVESVDLIDENTVDVRFTVPLKHLEKIRKDSVVRTIRPFIIGDKMLEVSVGSDAAGPVVAGDLLQSQYSADIMDVLGGHKLGSYLEQMGAMMGSLKTVLQAFSEKERAEKLVAIFDELHPTLIHVNKMARGMTTVSDQITRKKHLQTVVTNLALITDELNKAMPQIAQVLESSPHLTKDVVSIVENLSQLTTELTKVIPALAEVAPELPRASRRAVEAMDEVVIVLKAMQKSFLLSGSAEEVRKEEQKQAEQKRKQEEADKMNRERAPASE